MIAMRFLKDNRGIESTEVAFIIAVVVLAVIAVAVFFGLQDYVGMQVEKEVQNTLDRIPGIEKSSYGAVSYSVATKLLVVEKVSLDFKPGGPTKAEIERIEVSNPNMERIQNILTSDAAAGKENVADELIITGLTLSHSHHHGDGSEHSHDHVHSGEHAH